MSKFIEAVHENISVLEREAWLKDTKKKTNQLLKNLVNEGATITRNICKKKQVDLRSIPEFQWILHYNAQDSSLEMDGRGNLYVSRKGERYDINKGFYSGGTWEIAKYVRQVIRQHKVNEISVKLQKAIKERNKQLSVLRSVERLISILDGDIKELQGQEKHLADMIEQKVMARARARNNHYSQES